MKSINEFFSVIKYLDPICYLIEWNRIKFGREIGEGTFGKVYDILFPEVPVHYSMKIMQVSKTNDQKMTEIIQEIRLLHSLRHPNILPLYGISFHETEREYEIGVITPLKWGSLQKFLEILENEERDELPIQLTNEIKQKMIFGITSGLYYLASKNIIHRDIKPENILLDQQLNPFICDFGIAKEVTSAEALWNTQSGKGTILTQAPEIFLGEKYDWKSDIYSWSIVINSILEEATPWKEVLDDPTMNQYKFLTKVKDGERPKMFEKEEHKLYQQLIKRGWGRDTEKRPSINEIMKELIQPKYNFISVNEKNIKRYQYETLKFSPDFGIEIIEILECQGKQQMEKITKQQEEIIKQKEQSTKQQEEITKQKEEITKQKKQITKQQEEITKQNERVTKLNDQITKQSDQITKQQEIMGKQIEQITTQQEQITSINQELEFLKKQINQIIQHQNDPKNEILANFHLEYINYPEFKNDSSFSTLHFAAEKNLKKIFEILISKGADINANNIIFQNIKIFFLIKII